MFFWNSLAFSMFQWMLVIWSLVPLPFLNPAWASGISQFMYCWSLTCRILTDLSRVYLSWHGCWLPQHNDPIKSDWTLTGRCNCLHKSISEVMYSHSNYILLIKNDSLNSDLTQEGGIYSSSLESRHLTVFVSTSLGFPGNSSVKNPESACNTGDPSSIPWVGKFPWRRDQLPMPVFLGFRGGSDTKESACNAGDLSSITGLGRFPGGGRGNPIQ